MPRDVGLSLRRARACFRAHCGAPAGPVRVIVADAGNRRLLVTAAGTRVVRLKPVHFALAGAADTEPLPGKDLARLAGYTYPYARRALAELVALGTLRQNQSGYVLNAS